MLLILSCGKSEKPQPAVKPASKPVVSTTRSESRPVPAPAPGMTGELPIPKAGLMLWLAADDVRLDSEGHVESWENPGFPSMIARAGAPEKRPVVGSKVLNGHDVVHFDGVDDMLVANVDISAGEMPDATIVSVFTSATADSSSLRKLYGHDDGGYDRAAGLDTRGGEGKNYCVFKGTGIAPYFQLEAGEPYITVDRYSSSAFSGWVNGTLSVSEIPAAWGEGLANLYLGGSGTAFPEFWSGDLAEIIVYNRGLEEEERLQVERYLSSKYDVKVKTPE